MGWICSQGSNFLRRDHYASDPLLYGRSPNDNGRRVHQGRQGLAWFVCGWRGCWWRAWKQSAWWEFAPGLRCFRTCRWACGRKVHVRCRWEVQDVSDRRQGQAAVEDHYPVSRSTSDPFFHFLPPGRRRKNVEEKLYRDMKKANK